MKTRALLLSLCAGLYATGAAAQASSAPPPEAAAPRDEGAGWSTDAPLGATEAPGYVAPPDASPEMVGQDLQMTAQELAALGLDADKPKLDLSLRLSGFADVGFGFQVGPQTSAHRATGAAPAYSTFFVGNFNVYLAKQVSESFQMMSEVRLTFLPNGSSAFGLQQRVDTTAYDYSDFGRPTRWGGIILQRLYIEWTPHQLLSARVGQFLTPYGVWNVDHGSPVVIPVRRPWSIGVGWIPERQTGIENAGRAAVSAQHALGYHLTLSNGTGPVSEYADLDENKAVGARVYWEYYKFGQLRLGASGYYGRDTDARRNWVTDGEGGRSSLEAIRSQFDSLSWAADLTYMLGGLHIQTEWVTNQRAYTRKGRRQIQTLSNSTIIPVDVLSWGGYGLLGYRLPWLGVMPFVVVERVKGDLLQLKMKLYTLQGGLNIRPTEAVVFKVSYSYVKFQGMGADPINEFMSQIAWAF